MRDLVDEMTLMECDVFDQDPFTDDEGLRDVRGLEGVGGDLMDDEEVKP